MGRERGRFMKKSCHARIEREGALLAEGYLIRGGNYQFCWHRAMEVMLIMKGTADVYADGKQHVLQQGDLCLLYTSFPNR